jgi:TolB-like protein
VAAGLNLRRGFTLGDWIVYPLEGRVVGVRGGAGEGEGEGEYIHVQPKTVDVLLCLAAHAGEVVERETLLQEVWGERAQSDEPLTRCISELRRALGDSADAPDYVSTIPKRGYQLLQSPGELPAAGPSAAVPTAADGGGQSLPRGNFLLAALVLVVAVVAVVAVNRLARFPGESNTEVIAMENSIAVLPFVNMSDDIQNAFFSDGLSEELLNLLARIPELRVAARTSSFSFRERADITIAEIGRELNVAHVLEGSVRKSGDMVRITAQLIKADDGYHLWSESYDRKLDNIFEIQDEIAEAVANTLKITLLGDRPRARATDPEAYQLYLQGRYLAYQRTVETNTRAIAHLKAALEIDPSYVPAWAGLASDYVWATGIGALPIEEGIPLAEQAIETALGIDPQYPWTYYVRGHFRIAHKYEFEEGIADYLHALSLDPGNAVFLTAAGIGALSVGRFDEAISHHLAALELDPVKPEVYANLGKAYLFAGRFDEAEQAFRKNLALSPEYTAGQYRLGRTLLHKGELRSALAAMESEVQAHYRNTGLSMVYRAMGRSAESDAALQAVIQDHADLAAVQIAEAYIFRGEWDKAFEWLEYSLRIRDAGLTYTLGINALEGVSHDPRWQPFLRRLGLLDYWLAMPPEYGGPPG